MNDLLLNMMLISKVLELQNQVNNSNILHDLLTN